MLKKVFQKGIEQRWSPRGHGLGLEAPRGQLVVLGLGLGLGGQVLGLGLGRRVLGLGLGSQVLGLGLGLGRRVLGLVFLKCNKHI